MFYFLIDTVLSWNFVLIAAAAIPALCLMVWVYRSDRLEKESHALLRRLAVAGVLASLLALLEERVLSAALAALVPESAGAYDVILYFVIVAGAEESSKYLFLRRNTWRSPEFDCQYDGVVYAVFVSLGFALWENISYVMNYGFSTALVRAVTAIPGHACFGVFMGVFYGAAKRCELRGDRAGSLRRQCAAVAAPLLLHGAYDYVASSGQPGAVWYFILFIAAMFASAFILVGRTSKEDRYL